jgi:hypothetical protein
VKVFVLILLLAVALVLPGLARGGCWATVGLSSLPEGVRAGEAWRVELTVKQHGRTLLSDAKPTVTLRGPDGAVRVVAARRTARLGVYRAEVVFPRAGRWSYTIFDGFVPHCGRSHSYPAVLVRS